MLHDLICESFWGLSHVDKSGGDGSFWLKDNISSIFSVSMILALRLRRKKHYLRFLFMASIKQH